MRHKKKSWTAWKDRYNYESQWIPEWIFVRLGLYLTKPWVVNLNFCMCHIYWSRTEQLSVPYTETNVPWFPRLFVANLPVDWSIVGQFSCFVKPDMFLNHLELLPKRIYFSSWDSLPRFFSDFRSGIWLDSWSCFANWNVWFPCFFDKMRVCNIKE